MSVTLDRLILAGLLLAVGDHYTGPDVDPKDRQVEVS